MDLNAHNETIAELQAKLKAAEMAKERDLATRRKVVTQEIAQRLQALEEEFAAIKKLGESVEIVVYFSSGYEEFTYTGAENWNSSSMHC